MTNSKIFHSDEAPAAVGPYSQAISPTVDGRPVYLSGQLGLDPASMALVEGVEAQTRQAFSNMKAILAAAGLDLSDVMAVDVLLCDIADYAAVNGIYAEMFGDHKPARAAYQVSKLPLGALIEIKAVAWKANS